MPHYHSRWLTLTTVTALFYCASVQAALNAAEAGRFLTQATFGPTAASIHSLTQTGQLEAWLQQQFAQPASKQLGASKTLWLRTCPRDVEDARLLTANEPISNTSGASIARHNIWWRTVLTGEDQLRQRVAFALSQIFVVSDQTDVLEVSQLGLASYYDVLLKHTFGNYRNLLQAVTLHPAMGLYLSMRGNEKADPVRNIRPDENYARELLQLFTIGTHLLHLNGTPKYGNKGRIIQSYNQKTVQAFARVFTGWNLAGIGWNDPIGAGDRTRPMVPNEQYHDPGPKRLLNGLTLAAGQNARQDLNAALNNVFNHPNIAPFVSKQLIQRLVTSNPSNAYVKRVAQAFNNNGQGVRGDMKAVIKAILLDEEARHGHQTLNRFGKVREPVLRLSHIFRAFKLQPIRQSGSFLNHTSCNRKPYFLYRIGASWANLGHLQNEIGQAVLRAPSVFNFFRPDYTPPGELQARQLLAPELQIATENHNLQISNLLNRHILDTQPATDLNNEDNWSWLDLSHETQLAAESHERLLAYLNRVLLNGAMSSRLHAILTRHLNDPSFDRGYDPDLARNPHLEKARDAISLITLSPEYIVQR